MVSNETVVVSKETALCYNVLPCWVRMRVQLIILDLRHRHVSGAAVASEADEARTQAGWLFKLPAQGAKQVGVERSKLARTC